MMKNPAEFGTVSRKKIGIGLDNDFIEVYDFYKPEQDCKNAIEVFEEFANDKDSKSAGLSFFNKNRDKICTQSTFDLRGDISINAYIYKYVNTGLKSYVKKYDFLDVFFDKPWCRISPHYNVQRYDGNKEGYFSLHNEQSGMYPYRMLVWMIYLNDAKSGTEFPYQNKTITPKTGRTVIWPASWTHPHKGVTPNIGIKYIATGWFYYLPKGEPKLDGNHPDENIQEIVV